MPMQTSSPVSLCQPHQREFIPRSTTLQDLEGLGVVWQPRDVVGAISIGFNLRKTDILWGLVTVRDTGYLELLCRWSPFLL